MIYLITGVPGSGKSLKAVQLLLEWKAEGRTIYSDIEGLNVEGVLPSPHDWRDTPEGSVVMYDECQKIYPSTGRAGVADDERIRAMETHRHTGHDLVFITQAPTFLHHHIRKLVGKHFHLYRAMGLKGATVYAWDKVCQDPDDKREQKLADTTRWTYPKELFKAYKSATVHTHKFKIPKKLFFFLIAVAAALAFAVWLLSRSSLGNYVGLDDKDKAPIAAAGEGAMAPPAAGDFNNPLFRELSALAPQTAAISGCVSGKFCRCFDLDGFVIDLHETTCRDLAEGNLALPIKIQLSTASDQQNSPAPPPEG